MVTLDAVRESSRADLYPRHALLGCEDALVLFAAAFHGAQDAVWIADAGLTATCVDIDQFKLMQMEDAYPDEWSFVCADAFEYTTGAAIDAKRQWDVVSVDCPSNLFDRCAELVPLWCLLARRAVILGTGIHTDVVPPTGWQITERRSRSNFQGGVYWTVLERC